MTKTDLSIVMVTHNGRERALETLRSARANLGAVTAEWVVIDCGSVDQAPDAIEEAWADVQVIRCPNIGFAAANNVALERCRGRYVLLLNPDVDIAAGTLGELVGALDERPEVGLASVVQQAPDGSVQPSIRRFPTLARAVGEAALGGRLAQRTGPREEVPAGPAYATERSADWLVGAFLLARREAVDAVGPLDERFFLYSEETDWCFRMREAGWEVRHLPFVTIVHHAEGYSGRPDLLAQLSYSKVLYARKHFRPLRRRAYIAATASRHAFRAVGLGVAGLVVRRARPRAHEHAHALKVLLGSAPAPFARSAADA